MARNKDRNELEHLRGEIRSLEKENKRLKRLLRQQEKEHQKYDIDILNELLKEELNDVKKTEKCPQCHIGQLEYSDLGIKTLEKCTECQYRKTKNK